MEVHDSVVRAVIEKFAQRSEFGRKKYGTTLDRTDLGTRDWIIHAQEEFMDGILYLEKLKQSFPAIVAPVSNEIVVSRGSSSSSSDDHSDTSKSEDDVNPIIQQATFKVTKRQRDTDVAEVGNFKKRTKTEHSVSTDSRASPAQDSGQSSEEVLEKARHGYTSRMLASMK